MRIKITAEIEVEADSESEAFDAVNEILRPHHPDYATQTSMVDYTLS